MSENEKRDGMSAMIATIFAMGADLKILRDANRTSFDEGDVKEGLEIAEKLLEKGGIDFKALLDDFKDEQMKQDCKDAVCLTLISKKPTAAGAMMLLLKGVIMPLAEELKNARQTIESLMIATGKKEECK